MWTGDVLSSLKLEDLVFLAKPWVSWSQINTQEGCAARLGFCGVLKCTLLWGSFLEIDR